MAEPRQLLYKHKAKAGKWRAGVYTPGASAASADSQVTWSPDEKHLAFINTKTNGIELCLVALATRQAKKLTDAVLNDAYAGSPFE
ncbi:hypothetical protein [Pontibacter harenae]|uniref:hypothetical protein n=1 Tax=Pontibacter harenae TaxID=2894083 RepID=UPI001E4424F9|nr:hypothetical protein [Pontibacter harenae]MCC9168578.1 hypothetical protein [Pontibacter harenae]